MSMPETSMPETGNQTSFNLSGPHHFCNPHSSFCLLKPSIKIFKELSPQPPFRRAPTAYPASLARSTTQGQGSLSNYSGLFPQQPPRCWASLPDNPSSQASGWGAGGEGVLNGGANTAMAWPTKSKVGLSLWAHRAKVGKGGMQGLDGPLNLLPQKRQYAEQRT